MRTLELWRWELTDPDTGRRQVTRYRMSEADARALDPQASAVPGSLELREVPDDPEGMSTSSWQRAARQRGPA